MRNLGTIVVCASLVLFGCGNDKKQHTGVGSLELTGSWEDDFGGSFAIDDSTWGDQAVVSFDNDANVAITQNAADAEFLPGKFGKVLWTDIDGDGGFWFCAVAFGLDSAELAEAAEATGDDTKPGESGCGPFPWSRMSPGIEIFGRWESGFGGLTQLTQRMWGDATVISFDNATRTAITQNRPDDTWNPAKFNRVEWTEATDEGFHVCTVAFGKATGQEATDDPATADATDVDGTGCGGFPWTRLFDPIETYGWHEDQFGFAQSMTSGTWGTATVVEFDDSANSAILKQPGDDPFNPGKYSRVVWTQPDFNGEYFWCTETLGRDTAAQAKEAPAIADATDPGAGGCWDFAWSKATPTLEVFGSWQDNFAGDWQIGGGKWGDWSVVSFDNTSNRAIVQYPDDDEFNPGKYSKVFWTDIDADGAWAYCTANFGKDTPQEADEADDSADPTDLDGDGCGGFQWTRMAKAEPEVQG